MDLEDHPGRVRRRPSVPTHMGVTFRFDEAPMRPVTQRRAITAVAGATLAVLLAATCPGWAQESVAVRAMMSKGPIPLDDPNAAAWNSAPQSQFPMSPQVHWQNRIQEVTVKDIKVRALNDGQH